MGKCSDCLAITLQFVPLSQGNWMFSREDCTRVISSGTLDVYIFSNNSLDLAVT